MIHHDLRFEGIDATTLTRLFALFDPPPGEERPEGRRGFLAQLAASSTIPEPDLPPRGARPAVVLVEGGAPLRAFMPGGGVVSTDDLIAPLERRELSRWRERHQYAFVVAIRVEVLPDIIARMQLAVPLGGDLAAQALAALRTLEPAFEKDILVDPPLLGRGVKLPSVELLQRTFDHVLPDDRSFVLYVLHKGAVWASLIARKRHGDIDLITSHLALASSVRVCSVGDAARVCTAVTRRFAPPHIAAFISLPSWRRFVGGDRSALAAALAARQAVIDPCPRWLLALIGAGALTEAARRSARLAGKLLSSTSLGGLFGSGPEQWVEKMGNPLEALGLDPWELMRWARGWSRRGLPLVLAPEFFVGGET
ncbi:MAG: hypothetical protein JRH20_00635 [Deltaproteobacteria bacterium]|nr:hypothetical protein [Deltaproteobacteria bacterium]